MALESPVTVGRIVGVHGVRGEVKVDPLSDFPARFEPGSRLWLDGRLALVQRGRPRGRQVIVKLEGVDDRTRAQALIGKELTVSEPAPIEQAGVYYRHDIIGLEAEDEQGTPLGRVTEVLPTGANDVYVVHGALGELLLPAIDDVIKVVDLSGRRLVVDVPEGLEFTGAKRSGARRQGGSRGRHA